MKGLQQTFVAIFLAIFLFSSFASAHNGLVHEMEAVEVGQTLGDGKDGRVWIQWKGQAKEREIAKVIVKARKQSGGPDVYIDLRFENGAALDKGKQVVFKDNARKYGSWDLGRVKPAGRKLVLIAYNGEVFVETVTFEYEPLSDDDQVTPEKKLGSGDASFRSSSPHNRRRYGSRLNSAGVGSKLQDQVLNGCRMNKSMRKPSIEVTKVRKSEGLWSSKKRISGFIKAVCVEEAGYYESGELKHRFNFPLSDRYRREEFSIQSRGGEVGEIRVLLFDGQEKRLSVDGY